MNRKTLATALMPLALVACVSTDHTDIQGYMNEVMARPASKIEPIPIYPPYRSFAYGVMAKRTPFEKPVVAKTVERRAGPVSSIRPDLDRTREYLESFGVESLAVVGHIKKSGVMYGLINDGAGSVHAVKAGHYLGRNYGKIVDVSETKISMIEIVSNGGDSWVERPRTISLRE